MVGRFTKSIELSVNIAIITVAVLLSIVLVKNYLLPATSRDHQSAARVLPGTKLSAPIANWAANRRTLLLVLSDGCHFCSESAGFYQQLAQERAKHDDLRVVALLPQDTDKGRAYLDKLRVVVDDVKQTPISAVGVIGTPTLILVDGNGTVVESWLGKLPPEKEKEVLNRL